MNEAFLYAKSHSQFFDVLNSDEVIRKHSTINTVNQQQIKDALSNIKKQLRKTYVQNWLQIQSSTTHNPREKFTHKEIKHEYQLENYLKNIRNPALAQNKYYKIAARSPFVTHTDWKIRK